MQLELLGNRQPRNRAAIPGLDNGTEQVDVNGESARRRSVSDVLDSLLAGQGQSLSTIVHSDAMDSDGLSNVTTGLTPEIGEDGQIALSPEQQEQAIIERAIARPAEEHVTSLGNILPDSVEEPGQEEVLERSFESEPILENGFDSNMLPRIGDPTVREDLPVGTSTPHRVTILSSHPVDSLASHLASMITTVIFMPLESLYLRSLASSYLASTRSPIALRSDVIPMGAWGGGGSRTDVLAYMGKMTLMIGMQAAVNASVWGIISGAAIRVGRRFCGWGTL